MPTSNANTPNNFNTAETQAVEDVSKNIETVAEVGLNKQNTVDGWTTPNRQIHKRLAQRQGNRDRTITERKNVLIRDTRKYFSELTMVEIITLVDSWGVNPRGNYQEVINRVVNYELRRVFGLTAAPWDIINDNSLAPITFAGAECRANNKIYDADDYSHTAERENQEDEFNQQENTRSSMLQHDGEYLQRIAPAQVVDPFAMSTVDTNPRTDGDRLYEVCRYLRQCQVQFHGDDDDPVKFLHKIYEACMTFGISERELFHSMSSILLGDATDWWRAHRREIATYGDFTAAFNRRYNSGVENHYQWFTIRSRTQGEEESINTYITTMKGLFGQLTNPMSISHQLDIICAQLNSKCAMHIQRTSIHSYDELEEQGAKISMQLSNILSTIPLQPTVHSSLPAYSREPNSQAEWITMENNTQW